MATRGTDTVAEVPATGAEAPREQPAVRSVEDFRRQMEELVTDAEQRVQAIDVAQQEIATRLTLYRSELSAEERARLNAIAVEAQARLAELRARAAAPVGAPAEHDAVPVPAADTGSAEPVTDDQIIDVASAVPDAAPAASKPPSISESGLPAASARELLNIAKLRAQFADHPEGLEAALAKVRYAERRGILGNAELRAQVVEVVRGLSGAEGMGESRDAAIAMIAAEVGVQASEVRAIADRQRAVLEERARREVLAASRGSMKSVALKGLAYAGMGAVLQRFGGVGWLTAPVRMVEAWRQGSATEQKVQARLAELQAELATGDISDAESATSEAYRSIAAELAAAKQSELTTREVIVGSTDAEGLSSAMQEHLAVTHPELSDAQRNELVRAAGALYLVDGAQAAIEMKLAQRAPSTFAKVVDRMDRILGSRVLRGGETGKERALSAAVFAAAGVLAREIPGVRNFLFAYSGMKLAELGAQAAVGRAQRYEALRPVRMEELSGAAVTADTLVRARTQLANEAFLREHPAEAVQIRELVEQHEVAMITRAENAMDMLRARNVAVERVTMNRIALEREQKVVVNGARIAGALLGAALGPQMVQWVTDRLAEKAPESAPATSVAAEAAVAPAPEAPPVPLTDPELLKLAEIRPGDGFTQVVLRQLEYRPMALGFMGDPHDPDAVHQWAMGEAKALAQQHGFLDADGRTTTLGLQLLEGQHGFLLNPDHTIKVIGAPQGYEVHAPLGFVQPEDIATSAPVVEVPLDPAMEAAARAATGKVIDASADLRRMITEQDTKPEAISNAIVHAEERIAAARAAIEQTGGTTSPDLDAMRQSLLKDESYVATLRDRYTASGLDLPPRLEDVVPIVDVSLDAQPAHVMPIEAPGSTPAAAEASSSAPLSPVEQLRAAAGMGDRSAEMAAAEADIGAGSPVEGAAEVPATEMVSRSAARAIFTSLQRADSVDAKVGVLERLIPEGGRIGIPAAPGDTEAQVLLENRGGKIFWSADGGQQFENTYNAPLLSQIERALGRTGAT